MNLVNKRIKNNVGKEWYNIRIILRYNIVSSGKGWMIIRKLRRDPDMITIGLAIKKQLKG